MIKLDPNDWHDALWWYEDEPDVYQFMEDNESKIKQYAKENNMNIKNTISYLFEISSKS